MLKAVLFDLDGTLLDRDKSIEQFIDAQYDRLNQHLSHISKIDYISRFIELDCHGHVWKDGDNPEADILGAKSAKMCAIWKRNSHWLEPELADAIINELSEIPLLLDALA